MLGRKSEERDSGHSVHLQGSVKNEHPVLSPCLATATATATALGSAGPLPEARSAWYKVGFRSVVWTQGWQESDKIQEKKVRKGLVNVGSISCWQ